MVQIYSRYYFAWAFNAFETLVIGDIVYENRFSEYKNSWLLAFESQMRYVANVLETRNSTLKGQGLTAQVLLSRTSF